jgi:hypothetical protein
MIKELRAERGRERMAADREAHKRPYVEGSARPSAKHGGEALSAAEAKARQHRDKLLGFQVQNAQRTTIRDEAADFDALAAGNMWLSPEERARELKKQQKILREMEWNATPDYEKRRQVVSIDLVGGKVVKRMTTVEKTPSLEEEDDEVPGGGSLLEEVDGKRSLGVGGAFSKNPLLGGLIKPVYDAEGKSINLGGRKKKTKWRRVQDDLDNNENVILDGGIYRGNTEGSVSAADEPDCG